MVENVCPERKFISKVSAFKLSNTADTVQLLTFIHGPGGVSFPTPVPTGTGAYPASYTVGTGSLPGVKRPGRGVDNPPHLASRLKKV